MVVLAAVASTAHAGRAPALRIGVTVRASSDESEPPLARAECVVDADACDLDIVVDDRDMAVRIAAHDAAKGIRLTVTAIVGGDVLGDSVVADGRSLLVPLGHGAAMWLVPTRDAT